MSSIDSIRVFVIDDDTTERTDISRLLDKLDGIEALGEAGNSIDALQEIGRLAGENRIPDVVLMNLKTPYANGLTAAGRIVRDYPPARVMILTTSTDEPFVVQALHAGARGYLPKETAPLELSQALQDIVGGGVPLSPLASRLVVADYVRQLDRSKKLTDKTQGVSPGKPEHKITRHEQTTTPEAGYSLLQQPLTPRQSEVLRFIAEGFTTKEIAAQLSLSVKTIETHRSALMERLGIHDVAGLVRYALRTGLVAPDD